MNQPDLLMDETEARRRLDRIRLGLENVYDDVIAINRGQGWLALGYPTWAECCAAELPLRPALQAGERQTQAVKPMTEAGMSQRAIAEALDVSQDTVKRDQKHLSEIAHLNRPERVEGLDGKSYTPTIPRDLPKPATPELTEEDRRVLERQAADTRRWLRTAEAVITIGSISSPDWMEGFTEANLNDPIFTDAWNTDFLKKALDNLTQLLEWSQNRGN